MIMIMTAVMTAIIVAIMTATRMTMRMMIMNMTPLKAFGAGLCHTCLLAGTITATAVPIL